MLVLQTLKTTSPSELSRVGFWPFWGGFMSQWFPAPFFVDGIHYPTAEHYMMAAKARLFNDTAALARILATPYPKAAKEVGRSVRGYDDRKWTAARYGVVVQGNMHKFKVNTELRIALKATDPCILVEASPVDCIWGVGLREGDPRITNPLNWRGQNLLGFALMEVRKQF